MVVLKIILISLFVGALIYCFPLCRICGPSMKPTYNDGDILISTRFFKLKENSVYIFKRGDKLVIKRLYKVVDDECYFLGDNPTESYDSRDYGFISAENIIAKKLVVIKRARKED